MSDRAGVSGSPDETLRACLTELRDAAETLDAGTIKSLYPDNPQADAWIALRRAHKAATELLAGVGEHRPDQPQTAFCGDPYAHSAHEWIRGALRVDCPGTWMPSAVR